MKTLIVEDDFTSRVLIQEFLRDYGPAHVAVNGAEAVEAVRTALEGKQPYDLICMDIVMPKMDGQAALQKIRETEDEFGVGGLDRTKIIMTTARGDKDNVLQAFREQCDGYIVKPISKAELLKILKTLDLIIFEE